MMLLFEVDLKKIVLNRKMKIRIKYKMRHILLMKRLQLWETIEYLSSCYSSRLFTIDQMLGRIRATLATLARG